MRAELLTVGSELLSGATVNSNAADLARRLAAIGIVCQRQVSVGDARGNLVGALREALGRCDVLLITGGLGPTFDDLTMAAIAEAIGRPLKSHPAAAKTIRRFYAARHRGLRRAALRQAELPVGGEPLPNPLGTAPGLWLRLPQGLLIALPGVPREMRAILEQSVLPRLRRLERGTAVASRTLRTVGLVELEIEAILRTLRLPAAIQVGLYPHLRMVDVRLTATGPSRRSVQRDLLEVERALHRRLGAAVYGVDAETLEEIVGDRLMRQRKTLALAESCTGGLLSDRITSVPGSSRYLLGTVVSYHDAIKRDLLQVPAVILRRHGAVSAQAARAMARGAREALGADIGLAVTGIAGPSGGTARKPVGLVFLGFADANRTRSQRHQFFGDRAAIKAQAVQTALDWLRRSLVRGAPPPARRWGR